MASISTDISSELDITARRGDTFIMELSVIDPAGNGTHTLPMAAVIVQYANTTGTVDVGDAHKTRYGCKMSIADATTNNEVLSIYSPNYGDNTWAEGDNIAPTATVAGQWYGQSLADGGIDLSACVATSTGKIKIKVPASYMSMEPGVYRYDFQVRYKLYAGLDAEITTWLHGTFTVNADITTGTA